MAVAFDAATNGSGTTDFSFTHTPVGTPRGVLVFCPTALGTDAVDDISYGGVPLTEVAGSPNLKTTGETGCVHLFFLGSGVPTGAQSVQVNITSGGSTVRATCITLTGDADLEIEDVDATINSDSQANPSVTLSLGGKACFCAIGLYSGQGATSGITPFADWTSILEAGSGEVAGTYRYDIIDTADVTAGWTQTAEDAVAIAVAVTEAAGAAEIEGDLAATEAKDTAALDGEVLVQGSLASTEAKDALAITAEIVAVEGDLDATEAQDQAAVEGAVLVTGSLAATEAKDVAALEGAVLVQGDLEATEAQDAAAIEGKVYVTATLEATEAADTADFEGLTIAPATGATAQSYGGYTPEQADEWLRAANKLIELERKLAAPPETAPEQAALAIEAERVIEQVQEATGFDATPYRESIASVRQAVIGLMEKMHEAHRAHERRRRNNNWLMMLQ